MRPVHLFDSLQTECLSLTPASISGAIFIGGQHVMYVQKHAQNVCSESDYEHSNPKPNASVTVEPS